MGTRRAWQYTALVLTAVLVSWAPSTTPGADVPASSGAGRSPTVGVVPWIDVPAPPYAPPEESTPPAPPADARPCTGAQVSARLERGNGAGGRLLSAVRFRNVSRATCLLAGYPRVVATAPGRPAVVATNGSVFDGGQPANLAPGDTALLGLETDTYCAARPGGGGGGDPYRRFSITLPGGGATSVVAPDATALDLTCGLHLTHFFDPQYRQPEPIFPLSALKATLQLPATAEAGSGLNYVVALHNPATHALDLNPCPGYVEAATTPTPTKLSYQLNCGPVGTIAAGETVRFAMLLLLPKDTPVGTLTVRWALRLPNPVASGTVVVGPRRR